MSTAKEKKKIKIRVPIAPKGVMRHKNKKGKGSYRRNEKHRRGYQL